MFKHQYTEYLGPSFASETSSFLKDNPGGNLRRLVVAVDRALRRIHDKGKETDALRGVQGYACSILLHTIMHSNT